MTHARFGWVPDVPDFRDYRYETIRVKQKVLPQRVDLRKYCSTVEDQGALGSCTANALVGNLEFLEMRATGEWMDMSRLFIYYNERVLENTVRSDSGASLRAGIKTLAQLGVCSERLWPYDIAKFAVKPPQKCYTDALPRVITSYHRIETLPDMRTCLAEGMPFVFGFAVYESFDTDRVAKTGVVQLPAPGESMLGGHAVMATGYDDKVGRFIVRNSWGSAWGQQGYFSMPYEYLDNRNLSDDFWTIRTDAIFNA